ACSSGLEKTKESASAENVNTNNDDNADAANNNADAPEDEEEATGTNHQENSSDNEKNDETDQADEDFEKMDENEAREIVEDNLSKINDELFEISSLQFDERNLMEEWFDDFALSPEGNEQAKQEVLEDRNFLSLMTEEAFDDLVISALKNYVFNG